VSWSWDHPCQPPDASGVEANSKSTRLTNQTEGTQYECLVPSASDGCAEINSIQITDSLHYEDQLNSVGIEPQRRILMVMADDAITEYGRP
jgi:hypothetical protein